MSGNGIVHCYNAEEILEQQMLAKQRKPLPNPKDVFSVTRHTRCNLGTGKKMSCEALRGSRKI